MGWIYLLIPVVVISIPFYYFDLYLKKKIDPRKSFKAFLLYLIIMLPSALLYVTITLFIFFKLLPIKH